MLTAMKESASVPDRGVTSIGKQPRGDFRSVLAFRRLLLRHVQHLLSRLPQSMRVIEIT